MKHLLVSVALLCALCMQSCSKSGNNPAPVNPADTTRIPTTPVPPVTTGNGYTYDSSFKATGSFATIAALQTDGKIIIANTTQIARLNQDGTLDNSFASGTATKGEFHSMALQKDGKVLLGGTFTAFNSQSKAFYLRLNTDGSLDNSFATLPLTFVSARPNIDIKSIAIQSDNKILLGGNFFYVVSELNGLSSGPMQLFRVNTNGSYDASFKHAVTADFISHIRVLPDNKLFITGQFVYTEFLSDPTTVENRIKLIRLNTDGSIDPAFKWTAPTFGMKSPFLALQAYGQTTAIQDDGKVLLGGRFQTTSSVASDDYTALIRLKADGSIDNTFPKRAFDGIVPALCFTSDRLLIGTMHDPDRAYSNANVAIFQVNKDGTDNATYKLNNFLNYGDTYMILEEANKNLLLIGKFYDKLITAVYTYHGVIRLKRI